MKKRKQLISSVVLKTCLSDDFRYKIQVVKHTQMKTGISMYSLNLNDLPVVTCDSFVFLCELLDTDFDVVFSVLKIILDLNGFTLSDSESEE